ncbi:MAG: hypothetical protein VX670_11880, partial [Candidatus Latescibacterota bacterium]|nr:hypothetical protein [Candidatus Latescibacterota bacterium]
ACPREVYYLDANMDVALWGDILQAADEVARPGWTVPSDHPVFRLITDVVPWELERVQVYKLPKARREANDIPWTHRGCAL